MKKRTKIIAGIAGLVLLGMVVVLRGSNSRAEKVEAVGPVAVEVAPVSSKTLTETVSAVGTIAAMKDVMVSSETAGRITDVLVKVGDRVRKGQTLVQVDDELKAIAVEQAKAQVLAAETSYKKAKKDFERYESLYATKDVSDVELEAYRLAYRSAEAQYKTADANLQLAQRQLSDTNIKSPIDGYVASKKVEVGEMVAPGHDVANIVDVSSLKVKLSIPEEDIAKLQRKQDATLKIDSAPEKVFRGVVYSVGTKTETPMEHSYPVEVIIENKDMDVLKVGMFARVEIAARSVKNALTISKEFLVSEDGDPTVFVVDSTKTAQLRHVSLGVRAGDRVQVLSGLKEGDLVVSFGQKQLKDGSTVVYNQ